jgi:hypothetical protein
LAASSAEGTAWLAAGVVDKQPDCDLTTTGTWQNYKRY